LVNRDLSPFSMQTHGLFTWKEAPFLRLIIPLIAGIIVQTYICLPVQWNWAILALCSAALILVFLLPLPTQFRTRPGNGILLNILLFTAGSLLTYYKDLRHQSQWFSQVYAAGDTLSAIIEEPLSEKTKSCKTIASVEAVIKAGQVHPVKGKIILYFRKDSSLPALQYGNRLMFIKPPEHVTNTGNPGAFNYAQYCAYKGIWHQVYLAPREYAIAGKAKINPVKKVLYDTRKKVLNTIRENITGKKQAGLAEALLIGYKDDLDKDLLQSYINTGVVHVIAVSGLHLGLIYGVLKLLCKPFRGRRIRWATPALIITVLWLFTLLAGGTPSVLRSAIMFTCLAIGNYLRHPASVYNSLAASAFLLLCYDPYWCWDIGFQLSYAAVLSILLFMKPLYHIVFIKNKYFDWFWKLIAGTIAAQILTTPVSMYHFHQFPNLFLLTNLVAIPLSGLILIGELVLCIISFIPFAAKATGWLLDELIRLLNWFIENINQLPFNTTDSIQLNILQVVLLYVCTGSLWSWLLHKKKAGLLTGLVATWLFLIVYVWAHWQASQQKKLIVYNVPQHQAIDFIYGQSYLFKGDSLLQKDVSRQNFYLKPSRIAHRASPADSIENLLQTTSLFHFCNTSILVIDQPVSGIELPVRIPVDLIVLTNNPRVSVKELISLFSCRTIIIDGSNSRWKTSSWQQDCHKLGIACHAVSDQGAFVFTLH
jgi:competence protein ComEC